MLRRLVAAASLAAASAQSSCARRRLAVDDYDYYVDAYDEFQDAVDDSIDCGAGTILLEKDVTVAAQVEIYDGAAVTIAGRECAWDQKFGDGTCDADNNVADCLYDGGDCCVATCAGDGCPTTDADCDDDAPGDGDFLIPGSWSRALDGGGYGDAQDGGTQILWVSDAGTTLTLRHLVLYGGTCIRGDCATYSEDDDDFGGGAALYVHLGAAVLDDVLMSHKGAFAARGPEHPTVRLFWDEVRHNMDHERRALLVLWCTGSSQVPAQGFRYLQGRDGALRAFTLTSVELSSAIFPRAHTCFNRIDLPLFTTAKELSTAFDVALAPANAVGFSMD